MTIRQALQAVVDECPNEYAKTYARVGLSMSERDLPDQVLYVLSNTAAWKGDRAKEVKNVLKQFIA